MSVQHYSDLQSTVSMTYTDRIAHQVARLHHILCGRPDLVNLILALDLLRQVALDWINTHSDEPLSAETAIRWCMREVTWMILSPIPVKLLTKSSNLSSRVPQWRLLCDIHQLRCLALVHISSKLTKFHGNLVNFLPPSRMKGEPYTLPLFMRFWSLCERGLESQYVSLCDAFLCRWSSIQQGQCAEDSSAAEARTTCLSNSVRDSATHISAQRSLGRAKARNRKG